MGITRSPLPSCSVACSITQIYFNYPKLYPIGYYSFALHQYIYVFAEISSLHLFIVLIHFFETDNTPPSPSSFRMNLKLDGKRYPCFTNKGMNRQSCWKPKCSTGWSCSDSNRLLLPGRHRHVDPNRWRLISSNIKQLMKTLLICFVELDDAIRACHIVDEQIQVAFAQSSLPGRAMA